MQYLTTPSDDELKPYQFILDASKEQMGFIPNSMKVMARLPAVLSNFSILSGLVIADIAKTSFFTKARLFIKNAFWSLQFSKKKNRIPLSLRNFVAFVSSNASGCRYCQAHTLHEAIHNGASKEQIDQIWDFENSSLFSDKEKAAMRFGFAAGSVPNQVNADHFKDLRLYFNEEQIVELGSIIALFGFLNRWNDTFATQLEDEVVNNMEQSLIKNGWIKGKH